MIYAAKVHVQAFPGGHGFAMGLARVNLITPTLYVQQSFVIYDQELLIYIQYKN